MLSSTEMNGTELCLCLQNIGKHMFTAEAGDEIAEMYFTITPVSSLRLIIEQDIPYGDDNG